MIDVVIDGSVTARASGGPNLFEIEALPTRINDIRRMLEEAFRGSEFFRGDAERAIPLDVSVRLFLLLPSAQWVGGSAFAVVDAANRFSVTLPVDETRLDEGFTFALRCVGVVPDGFSDAGGVGGTLTPDDIPPGTPGNTPGAQLVAVMQARLRNIAVPVSITDLELFPVTIAPPPGETGRAFRNITNALIEFLGDDVRSSAWECCAATRTRARQTHSWCLVHARTPSGSACAEARACGSTRHPTSRLWAAAFSRTR